MPEQFSSKVVRVEAMKLTKDNLEEAAKWCGGRVFEDYKPGDPTDVYSYLVAPHVDGRLEVSIGSYLIKDRDKGGFYAMTAGDFESRFAKPTPREPFISRGSGHPLEVSLDVDEYGVFDPEYRPEPTQRRIPGAKQI